MKVYSAGIYERIESNTVIRSVRGGLVMAIPVLLIGSFALVLKSLPIGGYQDFMANFLSGFAMELFTVIHNGTFGLLSIYMTAFISICYAQNHADRTSYIYGAPIASLITFFIFSGVLTESFTIESFGAKGMFTAIFTALLSSAIYGSLFKKLPFRRFYSDGADAEFNNSLSVIFPGIITVILMASFNYLLSRTFHVAGFQALFINASNQLFENIGSLTMRGYFFVAMVGILWFFGIHGSDVLEGAVDHIFKPGTAMNMEALLAGEQPHVIYTKEFFDLFVLMGGCGSAICLLLALLLFSKRSSNRKLGKISFLPVIFNINEPIVFGLPIVYNPVLLIPFVLTPIVLTFTASIAMGLGLVPLTIHSVEWTTPVLIGGYLATGSLSGSVLQLFNICLGVLIYRPFVGLYDEEKLFELRRRLEDLVLLVKEGEQNNVTVNLLDQRGPLGSAAKMLALDLKHAMMENRLNLFYQPQHDEKGDCVGAEALLRFSHPAMGFIYPPLLIRLAEEMGYLRELERRVIRRASEATLEAAEELGRDFLISVNITVKTLEDPEFEIFLEELAREDKLVTGQLCLEITEQMAVRFDEAMKERITRIHSLGIRLAIDDFSMGSTSLKYLGTNQFDEVKLDGSLVKNVETNANCREIISSISRLAASLGFSLVAEYVETESQRALLEELGCHIYQGYLYSPAVPWQELKEHIRRDRIGNQDEDEEREGIKV